MHRRVFTGPTTRAVPLELPLNLALAGNWYLRRGRAWPGKAPEHAVAHLSKISGVECDELRLRVRFLARKRSVAPRHAFQFGLAATGAASWEEFVYDRERNWNAAASCIVAGRARKVSVRTIRRQITSLSDKAATHRRLARAGVAVPETVDLGRGAATETDLLELVERWGGCFLKPRFGSGGSGCFTLSRVGTRLRVTPWGNLDPLPVDRLLATMADSDYLAQPCLRSELRGGVTADTVNLRVVTRDVGEGPSVFSRVLEVPLVTGTRIDYVGLVVDGQGTIQGLPQSPWVPPPRLPPRVAALLEALVSRDLKYVVAGRHRIQELDAAACAAHREFPGMFAIAWDIVLTPAGAPFLEGNTGFGTVVPQLVGGGLLAGLDGVNHRAQDSRD